MIQKDAIKIECLLFAIGMKASDKVVSKIINEMGSIDATTASGESALLMAAHRLDIDLVQELIKLGADVNLCAGSMAPPLR